MEDSAILPYEEVARMLRGRSGCSPKRKFLTRQEFPSNGELYRQIGRAWSEVCQASSQAENQTILSSKRVEGG
jgi:hypothetical protein